MRNPAFFLSLCVVALVTACEHDGQTIDIECSDMAPCEGETVCVAGVCTPKVTELGGDCSIDPNLCAAPLTCEEGVCVVYHGPGESCSLYELCEEGTSCRNQICSVWEGIGESCDTASGRLCSDGLACHENRCVQYVGEDESCSEHQICVEGYFCYEGKCLNSKLECSSGVVCDDDEVCVADVCRDTVPSGGACHESVPCEAGTSCVDGTCVPDVGEGEPCDPESVAVCKAPYFCNDFIYVCQSYAELGASCDQLFSVCDPSLNCIDSTCVYGVDLGEACDESAQKICMKPYVCAHEDPASSAGVCVEEVALGAPCDVMNPCKDGNVCIMGTCLEKHGECASDSECSADTYCCLEEGCDVKNVCIAYGSGPRGDTDETCSYETVIGLFEAALQCEWTGPAADDLYPKHHNVLSTPTVIDTPHDSGNAVEIVVPTYNYTDGGAESAQGSNVNYYGVIRIFNGETCELLESIYDPENHVIASSPLTIADVDNDGYVEIIAQRGKVHKSSTKPFGLVMFKWNETEKRYKTAWSTSDTSATILRWDGPSMHDINDDGNPEIISLGEVFDAQTGKRLNPGNASTDLNVGQGYFSIVGDIDTDGIVELLSRKGIYEWSNTESKWVVQKAFNMSGAMFAYADFGIPGATPDKFNYYAMDGVAEIVSAGNSVVQLWTQDGQLLMNKSITSGGAPTVGDFDNDGFPEIGMASKNILGIYDPLCRATDPNCEKDYVLWERVTQDGSAMTGASLFDFDGDGQAEVLYGEECFTRIYDGKTGDVLFSSYRTSCTWYENPIVADTDRDTNAEIIVNSNDNCSASCPLLDSSHAGLLCVENSDCVSGSCVDGYCRCTTDAQCNSSILGGDGTILEYQCTAPLNADGKGNVCRAVHMKGVKQAGFRVLRDRLDRWASSRPIWNQHAYSVTNINDDQKIPKTSDWIQNFKQQGLNNYRQNAQGAVGRDTAPDITGYFVSDDVCGLNGNKINVGAMVCNRGTKMVASKMPATFYQINDDGTETLLCTSYTESNVPIGGCMRVSCEFTLDATGTGARKIRMVSNDDGQGGRTTVECNDQNNEDIISIAGCAVN